MREKTMDMSTTDGNAQRLIALHVENRDDEARKVVEQMKCHNDDTIRSGIEANGEYARKVEERQKSSYSTLATRWGATVGCLAGVGIIIWYYDITGDAPDVLISSATTLFFGIVGAAVGRYIAR
jgi:hypothetical protein